MFKYSPREMTKAWAMGDDVPEEVKGARLQEIIDLQSGISLEKNRAQVGRVAEVLVEGPSKRNESEWKGRTRENHVVIFPHADQQIGEYITVHIDSSSSATLFGHEIDANGRPTSIPLPVLSLDS
jgi:tRNA-2-methylthio-N6-dimethylallyladenosine synthase